MSGKDDKNDMFMLNNRIATDKQTRQTYITMSAVGKVWSSVNNNLNDPYGDLLLEELKPY